MISENYSIESHISVHYNIYSVVPGKSDSIFHDLKEIINLIYGPVTESQNSQIRFLLG